MVGLTFGEWLRRLRHGVTPRITVRELARAAGVVPSYISDIENGRRAPPGEESLFGYNGLAELLFSRGVKARDAVALRDRILRRVRHERAVLVAGCSWRKRRNTLLRERRRAT